MAEPRHEIDAASDGLDRPRHGTALRELAGTLPTVAHVLEAFIARANHAELAVATWDAEPGRRDEAGRREAAEAAARVATAREQALQQQIDELGDQLAEAKASASPAPTPAAPAPAVLATPTVLAAPPRTRWSMVAASFAGGVVVMLAVSRLLHDPPQTPPALPHAGSAAAAVRAAEPVDDVPAPPSPTVTPIEPPASPPTSAVEPPAKAEPAAPAMAPPPVVVAPTPVPARRRPTAPRPTPAPSAGELADPFDHAAPTKPARPGSSAASGQLVNPFSTSP